MAFTFIRAEGFERAPPFYQNLAGQYLVDKKFESFYDAFDQRIQDRIHPEFQGHTLAPYFWVVPVSVRPDKLPEIVNEAEIKIILKEEGTGIILSNVPEAALPILRARAVY